MAKANLEPKPTGLISMPHVTTKRAVRIAPIGGETPNILMRQSGGTTKRAGKTQSNMGSMSTRIVTRSIGTTKSDSGTKAIDRKSTRNRLPTAVSKERASRKAKSRSITSILLPAAGTKRKSADRENVDTYNSNVGRKRGDRFPVVTHTKDLVSAPQFPEELLQDYKVYRQIQNALVRLKNQITAIQKYDPNHGALMPLREMHQVGNFQYKITEKQMVAAVKTLPVWTWAESVRGIGANSLGQILGETGDLSNYSNPAKLWKRMGLGLVNGHRQQLWAVNRKGFTRTENTEMAVKMGYNPRRRALMAVIGANLIKARNPEYGQLYRDRKVYEFEKLPEKDENGKKNKSRKSHAHARALRYMEKRFLLDLWKAWRS